MGSSCRMLCRQCVSSVLIVMCILAQLSELSARPVPLPVSAVHGRRHHLRGLRFLVEETTTLTYHNGSVLTGSGSPPSLSVYLIWYGNFTDAQRSIILDFFTSTQVSNCTSPSVADWWQLTCAYKDASGGGVPSMAVVQDQMDDSSCSKGKTLLPADLESLVTGSLSTFPVDGEAVYLVLTDDTVVVDDFCNSECAAHYASAAASSTTQNQQLAFGYVGNPSSQCPGRCSWPFAQEQNGPTNTPLLPPNGDIGMDGMVINLGTILAGMATNPLDDGWYQGDATAPNEAASACVGMFGPGSYPGYAGQLLSDGSTGESFNTYGVNSRKYLLPGLWNPVTGNCSVPT